MQFTIWKHIIGKWTLPAALGLWTALAIVWLLDITGHGPGLWLARLLALVAVGATLVSLLRLLIHLWRRPGGQLLLAVLAVAFTVGLTGLAFEVGEGYYTDEGHYLEHAQRVNSGQLFARTMIYPHLLYYLEGFVLWISQLFPAVTAWLAATFFGVTSAPALPWMVLRLVTATLGILTVVPVFLTAECLAGRLAAVLASGAMIFAVQYHDGFHVNICDVPSGTFAAFCCYFAARLLREETTRLYLLAGVCSGLAAAAKHPAGVVAVAIVASWGYLRLRKRTWNAGLPAGLMWAGLASLGTYLAINPSFFVFPEETLTGSRGLFFGLRQYSQGGWIGVMPPSNTVYYLEQMLHNFRWPMTLCATIGLFGLPSKVRLPLLVFAVFPLTFLGLLISMNMVVVRNLFPMLPAVAVFLGVAASGVPRLLERLVPQARAYRQSLMVGLVLVSLALPAFVTSKQALAMSRPGTRELMRTWIQTYVPRGAGLLLESYTPRFRSVMYELQETRFAIRFPEPIFNNPRFDYILLSSHAHNRFFRPENQTEYQAGWYRDFFDRHELVHEVAPSTLRLGPHLFLYRLVQEFESNTNLTFDATEAFLPNPRMLEGASLRFARQGQFALFKTPLGAGRYDLKSHPPAKGRLQVKDLAGAVVAEVQLQGGAASLELPRVDKYFLYFFLAEGATLQRVHLRMPAAAQLEERPLP